MRECDVLVIGGGISGLSVAAWLALRGVSVELWERDPRIGGKIRTRHEAGYVTEESASVLANFLPQVDELIRAVGLEGSKQSRAEGATRYLYTGGRLQSVPMSLSGLLASPLWSWGAKLRLLAEPFVPRGGRPDETVSEFVTRRLGREFLEKAIEPFVGGPLAADPDLANARATLPRLTAIERRYGSITMGILVKVLGRRRRVNTADNFSFAGGMTSLVEALADTPGVALRTGREAVELVRHGRTWQVGGKGVDGEHRLRCRHVVLSTPAPATAALVAPVAPALRDALAGIPYTALAVAHLGLDRGAIAHPLDGTGFLAPRGEGLTSNGNLWMSRLFPGRAPQGRVLLSSYVGGARNPAAFAMSDAQLLDRVQGELKPILGIRAEPEWARIDRHPEALPLYHGDYPARQAAIAAGLATSPGLHIAANYLDGISVRDRIASAHRTADTILAQLAMRSRQTSRAGHRVALSAA